jgi:hypothetical protein
MVIAGVLVLAFACRSGDAPRENPEPQKTQPGQLHAASSTPSPAPSAPAALPPKATIELPAKGFKLVDVLGKTKRDVDRVLGHGEQLEDGPWQYDGFGKVGVLVVFEVGHAVFVSVSPPEFHNSSADRAAVLAWMQAPDDVEFDHTHNFDFELGVWAPGAQGRQLARRALAEKVTEGLKSSVGGFASANYTWMEVSLRDPDTCTRKSLSRIAQTYNVKSAGF